MFVASCASIALAIACLCVISQVRFFSSCPSFSFRFVSASIIALRRRGGRCASPPSLMDSDSENGSSEDTAGAVGFFESAETERLFWVNRRAVPHPLTPSPGQVFLAGSESAPVFGCLNFGEDCIVTHESECIRVFELEGKKQVARFPVAARKVKKYAGWLFCLEADGDALLQLDLRDESARPNRYVGLDDGAMAFAVNNFVGFGVTLFAITKDSFCYAWRCPAVGTKEQVVEVSTTFAGHESNVTSLDLGDRYLYTSSTDKTVRVWNYEDGKCVQVLSGHTDWVFSVKVIENRPYSGSRDETLRIWSERGECLSVIRLGSVAFGVLLEESRLFVRDALKRVSIYQDGKRVGIAEGSPGNVASIVVFRNVFATIAQNDNVVRVWSCQDGSCLALLRGHTDTVNAIVGFSTGTLFSASDDGCVREWDLYAIFEGKMKAPKSKKKFTIKVKQKLADNLGAVRERLGTVRRMTSGSIDMSSPRSSNESPRAARSSRIVGGEDSPRLSQSAKLPHLREQSPRASINRTMSGKLPRLSSKEPAAAVQPRVNRTQSAGVVGEPKTTMCPPRGSHAAFGQLEPLVSPRERRLSPRRRKEEVVSGPFNVTHSVAGTEKFMTIRSNNRYGNGSKLDLEELERQLKAEPSKGTDKEDWTHL